MASGKPRSKLLLVNHCSPGDVLMLTAVVRDLHRAHPNQYTVGVDTCFPDLWRHNPHLAELDHNDPEVVRVDCNHPPLLDSCNGRPRHYIESMHHLLGRVIGVEVPLSRVAPDLHLTDEERVASPVAGLYWLLMAGGKRDVTIKWWPTTFWQGVVDHYAGGVRFVQAGAQSDHHPPLSGVENLVGKTSLRELARLVFHAQGVVCPVTAAMHMAAAFDKPCVVIAGGREPPHWEMYPTHQFLHTVGQLSCCPDRGCWKARIVPLGDGDAERDANLCLRPVRRDGQDVAHCMDLIEPIDVIRAVDRYRLAARGNDRSPADQPPLILTETTARAGFDAAVAAASPYPGRFEGRGIVIGGGGKRLFPCLWVCVHMLRQAGCQLPIEAWHLGEEEMSGEMRDLLDPLDVRCVDAHQVRQRRPMRILNGWELKSYALMHCRFREALLLDADNVAVVDPTYLFEAPEYQESGAVLWPDFEQFGPERSVWRLTGVPYRPEPEVESGQILVDKRRCWKPLQLAVWMNAHSDFWYRHLYGDKDTFRYAWHKAEQKYAMPGHPPIRLDGKAIVQHDFAGRRLFQHRNRAKWSLVETPVRVPDFWLEDACLAHLEDLWRRWPAGGGQPFDPAGASDALRGLGAGLCGRNWIYHRIGYDQRPMSFAPDGAVQRGAAGCERRWSLAGDPSDPSTIQLRLTGDAGLTCTLQPDGPDAWRGVWLAHEQMPVELRALPPSEAQ